MANTTILILEDDFGAYQGFRSKLFSKPTKNLLALHSAITIEGAKKLLQEINFDYIFLNRALGGILAQWMVENNSHENAKIICYSGDLQDIGKILGEKYNFRSAPFHSDEFTQIVSEII